MIEKYGKASIYASYFSVLVPIIIFLIRRKCYSQLIFKILLALLVTSALSDLIGFVLIKSGITSLPVSNIFYITQFILVSVLYTVMAGGNKNLIYSFASVFTCYWIYVSFYLQEIGVIQYLTYLLGSAVIVIYVIIHFVELFKTMPTMTPHQYPPFWISIGVLIYFAFNVFVFLTSDYASTHFTAEDSYSVWFYLNLNNIIKNGLFAIAIYFTNKIQVTPYEYILRKKIKNEK